MHRSGTARDGSAERADRAGRKPTPTPTPPTSKRCTTQRSTAAPRNRDPCSANDAADPGESADEEVLRARVRLRIQQRVSELQAMDAAPVPVVTPPAAPLFLGSLHQDVVQTAAQILGKYLASAHPGDEPLELALVHRMLVKEVELQALQLQRANAH